MGAEYFDDEQKRMKLDRTICLYKGEPYYIRADIYGKNLVSLYELGSMKKIKDVDYREEDFNYTAVSLGYTNWDGVAYYTSRVPERQNSQGLGVYQIMTRPKMYSENWFVSEAVKNTIKGIYPSLDKALSEVGNLPGQKKSIAFSRYFAVESKYRDVIGLNYRGREVGYLEDRESKKFRLIRSKPMSLVIIAAKREGLHNVST